MALAPCAPKPIWLAAPEDSTPDIKVVAECAVNPVRTATRRASDPRRVQHVACALHVALTPHSLLPPRTLLQGGLVALDLYKQVQNATGLVYRAADLAEYVKRNGNQFMMVHNVQPKAIFDDTTFVPTDDSGTLMMMDTAADQFAASPTYVINGEVCVGENEPPDVNMLAAEGNAIAKRQREAEDAEKAKEIAAAIDHVTVKCEVASSSNAPRTVTDLLCSEAVPPPVIIPPLEDLLAAGREILDASFASAHNQIARRIPEIVAAAEERALARFAVRFGPVLPKAKKQNSGPQPKYEVGDRVKKSFPDGMMRGRITHYLGYLFVHPENSAIDKQKKHYYSVLFADRDWWERVPQDSVQRCSDRDLEESDDLSD